MNYQAIETYYRGRRFRSRIEASWAAFFDLVKWRWEYEPVDMAGYIPDFVLEFPTPVLVEVKSSLSFNELHQHKEKVEASGWVGEYLLLGAGFLASQNADAKQMGGLLGEKQTVVNKMVGIDFPAECADWGWNLDESPFGKCAVEGIPSHYGLCHVSGWYGCRACEGYPGGAWPDDSDNDALWAAARNETQWRGKGQ